MTPSACKSDLLRCAALPEGWIDDLDESTRRWASDLPMEALLAGLRMPGRFGGTGDLDGRVAIRVVLLAIACKDPDLLDIVADEHLDLLPMRGRLAVNRGRPAAPSLAA